jgi:hypothetical protein
MVLIAIIVIFYPFGRHDRVLMNHIRAVASMQRLMEAERKYAEAHAREGFACELKHLYADQPEPLIDRVLAEGEKAGYRFEIRDCAPGSDGRVSHFMVAAEPLSQQVGHWSFCSNQEGVLWFNRNGSAARCIADKQRWIKKRDHYK